MWIVFEKAQAVFETTVYEEALTMFVNLMGDGIRASIEWVA